jgi:hypothetical protein
MVLAILFTVSEFFDETSPTISLKHLTKNHFQFRLDICTVIIRAEYASAC